MVKNLKLRLIVEDSISSEKKSLGLKAEHGLSMVIETTKPDVNILIDTGQKYNTLKRNIEALGINIKRIDVIFLSHGHYDHTGGLEILRETKGRITVIAHPEIFAPKFKIQPYLKYIGIPFHPCQIELLGGKLLLARNPVKIAEGIKTTGEIDRITEYEKTVGFWTVKEASFMKDLMRDDQSLVVNLENKGLVIISGCAHSGIINTIKQAQRVMNEKNLFAVIGGFHLINANSKRIEKTLDDLIKLDIFQVYPCHCTGKEAVTKFQRYLEERCKPINTGDAISF